MENGCYCLTTDFKAIKPENWDPSVHEPQGVLMASEDWRPFVMGLEWGCGLPWAEKEGVDCQDLSIRNRLILDSLEATKEIVRRHKDAGIAAPAAEWCLDYSYGRIGKGWWALPSNSELYQIARYKQEIVECYCHMSPKTNNFLHHFFWSCTCPPECYLARNIRIRWKTIDDYMPWQWGLRTAPISVISVTNIPIDIECNII